MATGAARIEMIEGGPHPELSASTRTVESAPPRRGVLVALGIVAVLAGSLALTRGGDSEPAAAAAPESTTTSTTAEPTTTTTPPPPSGEAPDVTIEAFPPPAAIDQVDVSAVPEALRDTTIVLPGRPALAVDLATGGVSELGGIELDEVERVIDTSERGVVVRDENGSGKLVDWSFERSIGLGWNIWPGNVVVSDDNIWLLDGTDERELVRIDLLGRRTTVRPVPEWVSLVGGSDGSAYVSSVAAASVVRIDEEDRLTRISDGIGAMGGEEWLLLLACDDELDCGVELADLRTGRRIDTDIDAGGGIELVQRSPDGRRALVREWTSPSSLVLLDADGMTAERLDLGGSWDEMSADPSLTHLLAPSRAGDELVVVELATGLMVRLPLPRPASSVIVTPGGWEPATSTGDGASATS